MSIAVDAQGYFQTTLSGDQPECKPAGEMVIKNWKKASADMTTLFALLGGGTPTSANKKMAAATTTLDNDVATATAVAFTPANDGHMSAEVNGVTVQVGDGTKSSVESYFSGDGGITARLLKDIVGGDKLYWNGSIAGYQLTGGDRISFNYNV